MIRADYALLKWSLKMDKKFIQDLKYETPDVRSTAAEVLGYNGDKSAIPALIEELKDRDKTVRWHAVRALEVIGAKSAVPALIEALKDSDKTVRWRAASALGAGVFLPN